MPEPPLVPKPQMRGLNYLSHPTAPPLPRMLVLQYVTHSDTRARRGRSLRSPFTLLGHFAWCAGYWVQPSSPGYVLRVGSRIGAGPTLGPTCFPLLPRTCLMRLATS